MLASLLAMSDRLESDTALHLLIVTRVDQLAEFRRYGVVSFDSTSPLRQAFKDADDNYYTPERNYTAIRVPQVEGNPRLQKLILAGKIPQTSARVYEQACLSALRLFEAKQLSAQDALDA